MKVEGTTITYLSSILPLNLTAQLQTQGLGMRATVFHGVTFMISLPGVCSVKGNSGSVPATIRSEGNASGVFLAWTCTDEIIGFGVLFCLLDVFNELSEEYQ